MKDKTLPLPVNRPSTVKQSPRNKRSFHVSDFSERKRIHDILNHASTGSVDTPGNRDTDRIAPSGAIAHEAFGMNHSTVHPSITHHKASICTTPSIQRTILIGETVMDQAARDSFLQSVREGTLMARSRADRDILLHFPDETARFLNRMADAPENITVADQTELIANLAGTILPFYLTGQLEPQGDMWQVVTPQSGHSSHLRSDTNQAFLQMQVEAEAAGHHLTLISAMRNFADQLNIWNLKMQFDQSRRRFGAFDIATPPVSTTCNAIPGLADNRTHEWDTSNEPHRLCWNMLTPEQRAIEILKTSSAPGTSRHHWGTDIDICSTTPSAWEESPLQETYAWLVANANRFGFFQTYTDRGSRGDRGYNEEKWHWSYSPVSTRLLDEYRTRLYDRSIFEQYLRFGGDLLEGRPPTGSGRNVEETDSILSLYQEYVEAVAQPSLKDGNASNDSLDVPQRKGEQLSGDLRGFFIPRLGFDYGKVRIHTDAEAADSAERINAKAYTIGNDVFFNRGYYRPESREGLRLLAHELVHVGQQRGAEPIVRRHGIHTGLTNEQRYEHTLEHAGMTRSAWDAGYLPTSDFLGVPIIGGIHRVLKERLDLAALTLRALHAAEGLSDAQIAAQIGLHELRGRRAPATATGQDHISYHCFGLAIDIDPANNLYIALSTDEGEIIERATALVGGYPINIRNTEGFDVIRLHHRYVNVSRLVRDYFAIREDDQAVAQRLRAIGIETTPTNIGAVREQMQNDYRAMTGGNPGWDPDVGGFYDLSEELVNVLCNKAGLSWGGQLEDGADLMHFDWRGGNIRPGDRV